MAGEGLPPAPARSEAMGAMKPEKIHILFSSSAAGTLRQVLAAHGSDDEIISLPDRLSFGPIDSIEPEERSRALVRTGLAEPKEVDWLVAIGREFWSRCASSERHRIVWVAPQNPDEMAGFLAYLHRFGDRPFDFVDPDDHGDRLLRSDGRKIGPVIGLGVLSERHIAILKELARPWRPQETQPKRQLWERLVRENALLRVPGGDDLVSVPEDLLDQDLLGACTREWKPMARVLGEVLIGLFEDRGYALSDDFLEWRMRRLVAGRVLESRDQAGGAVPPVGRRWQVRIPPASAPVPPPPEGR